MFLEKVQASIRPDNSYHFCNGAMYEWGLQPTPIFSGAILREPNKRREKV